MRWIYKSAKQGFSCWFIAGMATTILLAMSCTVKNTTDNSFEAESATIINSALTQSDDAASGGRTVRLAKQGDGLEFNDLPAAGKLAISYASLEAGTISVSVNNKPPRKVNVHSSGAVTNSFLNAVIDIEIPANGTIAISLGANDVAVNLDYISIGNGDLSLPPDIWNLPDLPIASGPFSPDWKQISQRYTVPDWWREAKFGAWSHWDPQSVPEQGDWYAK